MELYKNRKWIRPSKTSFLAYQKDLKLIEVLDPEQQRVLIEDYQTSKNVEVRNEVVVSVLRWVAMRARQYAGHLDQPQLASDLAQEGNLAVFKAIERFDLSLSVSFIHYLHFAVASAMQRCALKHQYLVWQPFHIQAELSRIRKYSGCDVGEGVLKKKDVDIYERQELLPLAVVQNSDDLVTWLAADVIDYEYYKRELIMQVLRERVKARDAQMFQMRYGLGGEDGMTLEEVAQHFEVTRERVRQIVRDVKQLICELVGGRRIADIPADEAEEKLWQEQMGRIELIGQRVHEAFGGPLDWRFSGKREALRIRELTMFVCRDCFRMKHKLCAAYFGLTIPSVWQNVKRVRLKREADQDFRAQLEIFEEGLKASLL